MTHKTAPEKTHTINIILDDITRLEVDAIVNAANEALLPGGGVCGAIHRAAGPELEAACRPLAPCPTGEARITSGFGLKAKYVIHTVGPVWHGGTKGEADLLASCYRQSILLAVENKLASVAFPAISTGIFGSEHIARNLFHFVRFWRVAGKAQRAERCGASLKRCNAARGRQKRTLRAGTFFRPAASRPLSVAPLRSADLFLPNRRMSSAKGSRFRAICSAEDQAARNAVSTIRELTGELPEMPQIYLCCFSVSACSHIESACHHHDQNR